MGLRLQLARCALRIFLSHISEMSEIRDRRYGLMFSESEGTR